MLGDFAARIELWPPDQEPGRIAGAVSGGADSLFLLHLLSFLKNRGLLRAELLVYHLNHCLREDAQADLMRTAAAARALDLPLYLKELDVARLARRLGTSLETAGRQIRYRQLRRLAAVAATGHNADDFVESLLLHMCRNAGPGGLGGMRRLSRLDGLWLWRPLLSFTAAEIREVCRSEGIDYARDTSNASTAFKRNRIRQEIMPALKAEGLRVEQIAAHFLQARADAGEDPFSALDSAASSLCLDRRLLPSRAVMERAFFVLSLPPPSRAFFQEFQRQWVGGRLYMQNQQCIAWASRTSPLWLFRSDAKLLRQPEILKRDANTWQVEYNDQSRVYSLRPGESIGVLRPGIRFASGNRLKDVWHDWQFPRPLRRFLPLILSAEGFVTRACTEFVPEFRLLSFHQQ